MPVLPGTSGATGLKEAQDFLATLGAGGAMMIKAVAGGGGRGIRAVTKIDEVEEAYNRCQSEARSAFGNGDVYVEQLIPRARHIEVQIIGDSAGGVSHLWERECTIQRRNQKLIEVAPSPGLAPKLRDRLLAAAVSLAHEVRYDNLGTFEFLVDAGDERREAPFAFIEANPRLQVEHTVTEEVTGVDLVKLQLKLAAGYSLAELGLLQADVPHPRGFAIQARINMESMGADGVAKPAGGTIAAFEMPSGPGLRVDTFGYAGYTTSPRFDSLLAKLIAYSPSNDFADAVAKAYRALCEVRIEGVATNIGFLQSLLKHPAFAANQIYTRFIEDHLGELIGGANSAHRRLFFEHAAAGGNGAVPAANARAGAKQAGARIDTSDPLAVLHHGKGAGDAAAIDHAPAPMMPRAIEIDGPEGTIAIHAPMQGTIISIDVSEGETVRRGRQLFVMEAMKMEHVIAASSSGVVRQIAVAKGDAVFEGAPLAFIEESAVQGDETVAAEAIDLDRISGDLAEVRERHAIGLDDARPDAVASVRRRRRIHAQSHGSRRTR